MCEFKISIIGFGASGASFFVQLIKLLKNNPVDYRIKIFIFDKSTHLAKGLAYSTMSSTSLLNSTTARMCIFHDAPLHFYQWLQTNKKKIYEEFPTINLSKTSYLPRSLFGQYLNEKFKEYLSLAKNMGIEIEIIPENVINFESNNHRTILTEKNKRFITDALVLCTGYQYNHLAYDTLINNEKYVASSYPEMSSLYNASDNFLVIGSRLSAIDIAMSILTNHAQAKVTLLSRSGLMPMVMKNMASENPKYMKIENIDKHLTLENMISLIKKELARFYKKDDYEYFFKTSGNKLDFIKQANAKYRPWQNIASHIDEYIENAWPHFTEEDQKTFVDQWHLKLIRFSTPVPYETAEKLVGYFKENRLFLSRDIHQLNDKKSLQSFDWIINATGYDDSLQNQQLYKNLVDKNLIKLNAFGGLTVDENMRFTQHSLPMEIYALGPPIFGTRIINNFLLFIAGDAYKLAKHLILKQ